MKKQTKGFIAGLLTAPVIGLGAYFVYKVIKPDYLKDYEEDDDFEPEEEPDEDDFDDFDDLDDLDDLEESVENARENGVPEEKILHDTSEVDNYFTE